MKRFLVPLAAVALAAAAHAYVALPPKPARGGMDLEAFGRLPVQDGGRVKPLDTLARVSLTVINNRQSAKDADGREMAPVRWLLDTMTYDPDDRDSRVGRARVFRIDNTQLLQELGLENRPGSWRYSLDELGPKLKAIGAAANRAGDVDAKKRDLYQVKVIELSRHLQEFIRLRLWGLAVLPPEPGSAEWASVGEYHADALTKRAIDNLKQQVSSGVFDPEKEGSENVSRRIRDERARLGAAIPPAARDFIAVLDAYKAGDADGFNRAVAAFAGRTAAHVPPAEVKRSAVEVAFNRAAPFYYGMYGYLIAFATVCVGWLFSSGKQGGNVAFRTATAVAVGTFVMHTVALLARMYLMDRPLVFVTNLYSSAIFIGWCAALVGLIVERLYGRGIGTALTAVAGGASLLVAYYIDLGMEGDKLEMMQAVLDTNFWLATHVTTVTFGYAATFVAGFVGIAFILLGVLTPFLDRDLTKALSGLIYGVVCFATLLSFTGTVLGGIWADYSWGRFWGWDPKENGAMLIVLWNALILHARWAGMIKSRGLAILAVFGNVVTAWSWFGTNQLGIGLHSYGFTSAAAMALVVFNLAMLAVMGLGTIPERHWNSRLAMQKS